MSSTDVTLSSIFAAGWQTFRKNPFLAIGGIILLELLSFAWGILPGINIIYGIFLAPAMMGGLITLFLHLAEDKEPDMGDLFAGFRRYGRWMGISYLLLLFYVIALLPALIFVFLADWLERGMGYNWLVLMVIVIGSIISLVLLITITIRLIFAVVAIAEGDGVIKAIHRSMALSRGQYLHIFGMGFMIGFIANIGNFGFMFAYIIDPFILRPFLFNNLSNNTMIGLYSWVNNMLPLLWISIIFLGLFFAAPLGICAYIALYKQLVAAHTMSIRQEATVTVQNI